MKYCLFQTIRFHRKARREKERERVSLRSRLHISNICRNIYVNVTIEFERPSMLNRDWKIRATTAAYIRNPPSPSFICVWRISWISSFSNQPFNEFSSSARNSYRTSATKFRPFESHSHHAIPPVTLLPALRFHLGHSLEVLSFFVKKRASYLYLYTLILAPSFKLIERDRKREREGRLFHSDRSRYFLIVLPRISGNLMLFLFQAISIETNSYVFRDK